MYTDIIRGNNIIRGKELDSSGAKVLYIIEIMLVKILTTIIC